MKGALSQPPRGLRALRSEAALPALIDRFTPRPLIGGVVFLVAVATAGLAWAFWQPAAPSSTDTALLIGLVVAVAGSHLLPIRVGKTTHLYLSDVPLYLLCCLFAPPLAMTATGVGMLIREINACRRCVDNTAGVVGAQVGRWMLLILAVSAVVHLFPADYVLYGGALAAVLLWIGDVCSAPLVFSPVTGKNPFSTIAEITRQSYAGELMQYLIALFALAFLRSGVSWIGLFYVPLILMSLLLLYLYLRAVDDTNQMAQLPLEEAGTER